MKLLVILPSTMRGGVEEYALKITSAAVCSGWDVHIGFPQTATTIPLIQDFADKGVRYHRLNIAENHHSKLWAASQYGLRLLRTLALLLKIKPDVVQIILPWPDSCLASILACGLLKVPTLVRFGLVPYRWSFSNFKLKAYAWARNRNQQWLAISENNRRLISESFQIPLAEVLRIYNGSTVRPITTRDRPTSDIARREVRQELGLAQDQLLALTVGRLDPQKGYTDLVPTIPHLVKEFPQLQFAWVGDGSQRQELMEQVQAYGVADKVSFLGYRSDVPRLLQASDLFVFPTHYEGGQSFALAEAMAYGLPIVTSDASGIPEVISQGVHGLIVRTGDSCDLLEGLRWALRNPEPMQTMAERAQQRVSEFSHDRMVKETLEALEKLSHKASCNVVSNGDGSDAKDSYTPSEP